MTTEHPITPPPELVQQWHESWYDLKVKHIGCDDHIAIHAARWGADQELEACCTWLSDHGWIAADPELRSARRPKPPSLAEEALEALEQIDGWAVSNMNHLSIHDDLVTGVEAIRTALERLKELEKGNG